MKKLFTFLIIGIFLIGLVSAAEWDNKKNYNPDTKEVKIVNTFGLGGDVAKIKLTSELNVQVPRGYQQVAEFDLTYYLDNNGGLDKIDFFDIKNSMNQIDRQFDYKIKTIEEVSVNDYETICSEKLSENGTKINDCIQKIIGNHLEERIVWNDFNEKDLKKSEQVTIGIFTDVQKGDSVEWIPTFYGVEIGEWATWTESLSVGLISYYKLDSASTILVDAIGNYNGTINATAGQVGIINNSYNFSVAKYGYTTSNITEISGNNNRSLFAWINPISYGNWGAVFGQGGALTTTGFNLFTTTEGNLTYIGAGANILYTNFKPTLNTWSLVGLTYDGVSVTIHMVNATGIYNTTAARTVTTTNTPLYIGKSSYSAEFFSGRMDEMGIWNNVLLSSQIAQLYNEGSGITYIQFPTVTLNSPINNYNSSSINIIFNCSASNDVNLINVSLYINSIINETNSSGINGNYIFTKTLTEGNYNWTCEATDNINQTTTASYRNLLIDTIYPTINITYPTIYLNYGSVGNNETLNWTITDNNTDDCWYNYNGTNTTVTCGVNTTTFKIEALKTNLTFYANDSVGHLNSTFVNWDYKVLENNRTHNSSTYETARESYSINLTANASLTAVSLFYNGSYYSTTKSGDIWTYTRDIPSSVIGSQNFSYRFTYGGDYINSTQSNQAVNTTIFGLCNATVTNDFLNISFKDESNASAISAAISTSSFVYYLGSGTVNKTYTLINNSGSTNYTFCAIPTDRILHVDPYVQYVSTSYPQRIWNPDVTNYNSTVTNQVLYLLESTDGLYVTFQIVNSADQILTGALVIATREIAGIETEVGRGTTGGDGTVTLWLNPDFNHKFTFSKDGFETYETSFAPTQSSYTITMSGGGTAVTDDYTRGILIYTYPIQNELFNDTSYNFEFNVTSSFWDLDSFGFSLRLANGTIVGSDSSTVSGTAASVTYDVNNQTIIYMDYYWIIDGNTTSSSKYWVITNTEYEGWSIKTFFIDLNTYLDSGLFGIDNFGRIVIIFLILFTSVGIMSYKFGLVSPMAVTSMIFAIVFFMDVVVGLIPQIRGINYIVTYIAGLILILAAFNEVSR